MYNQNSSTAHNWMAKTEAFDHKLFSLCFISPHICISSFCLSVSTCHSSISLPPSSCAADLASAFPLSNAVESVDWLFLQPYWVSSQRSEVWFQSEQPVTVCGGITAGLHLFMNPHFMPYIPHHFFFFFFLAVGFFSHSFFTHFLPLFLCMESKSFQF